MFGEDKRSITPKLTKGNVDQLTNDRVSQHTKADSIVASSKRMRRASMDDQATKTYISQMSGTVSAIPSGSGRSPDSRNPIAQ